MVHWFKRNYASFVETDLNKRCFWLRLDNSSIAMGSFRRSVACQSQKPRVSLRAHFMKVVDFQVWTLLLDCSFFDLYCFVHMFLLFCFFTFYSFGIITGLFGNLTLSLQRTYPYRLQEYPKRDLREKSPFLGCYTCKQYIYFRTYLFNYSQPSL